MKRILNLFGCSFVKYEAGSGLLIVDYGLTSVRLRWNGGARIIKKGKILVLDECGEVFAKFPESQDHRKYIKLTSIT